MLKSRRPVDTRQTARPFTLPAPTGGLNGRESLADMPPNDAYFMDNWVPGTASCFSRGGYVPYATGAGAAVESLAVYAGSATPKMLAFANGSIFDVTTNAPVGAALQSGRAGNAVVTAMFSNAGSQFLIGTSGLDVPFAYNGAAVTNLAITGVTGLPQNLQTVFAFKGRLYFTQLNQLGFYYLPVGQIQGAAVYFDLSQVALRGGKVVAMASFSMQDTGTGPNDYAVFITSEGEYIVYGGFDPSSTANWSLVGRYYSAPPIGRSCAIQYNSDLLVITTEGLQAFSSIREGSYDPDKALTARLGSLLTDSTSLYANIPGWQAFAYSRAGLLILNVPAGSTISSPYVQYAMNTKTGKWTRFTGQNALCWTVFKGRIYFGDYTGRVCLADEGRYDNAVSTIQLDCKQAFNLFDDGYGSGFSNKQFHFAKLIVNSDGTPPLSARLNTDYVEKQPDYATNILIGAASMWDVSAWDETDWASDGATQNVTLALGEFGQAGSLWLRASLAGTRLEWYATQYIYSKAAGLF